jgi:hypothetical protein
MKVVKIQMNSAIDRVAKKGISLSASDAALDVILSESYNPVSICSFSRLSHVKLHFLTFFILLL